MMCPDCHVDMRYVMSFRDESGRYCELYQCGSCKVVRNDIRGYLGED